MSDTVAKNLNWRSIEEQIQSYGQMPPFDHVVIDNFFNNEFALQLSSEFPEIDSDIWHLLT